MFIQTFSSFFEVLQNAESVVQRCSVNKVFLKVSQNSQNTCVRVSFLIKLQVRLQFQHRCFPVNFAKFLRTPFSQNISGGYF